MEDSQKLNSINNVKDLIVRLKDKRIGELERVVLPKQVIKNMSLKELEAYHFNLRKYDFYHGRALNKIQLRKAIHKILWTGIKVSRYLDKDKLTIMGDKREKRKGPVIYACTHIGGKDVERVFEAIKDHAYLFLGDPKDIYRDFTGKILNGNGVICFETQNKEDRKIAVRRAIELLQKGGSLLIFPEGAWNITETLPVMKLYSGAIKMAKATNVEIVPVAIEQYGNHFYCNIGKNNKDYQNYDIIEAKKILREQLATLKWEIFESQGIHSRREFPDDCREYLEQFQQEIVNKCPYGFTVEDVKLGMYKELDLGINEQNFQKVKVKN